MTTRLGERPVTKGVDAARVESLLLALEISPAGPVHLITIPGAPHSKSRPRFTRTGRTYHKSDDVKAEHRTGIYLRATVREPFTGNVAIACLFFRPDRQRIDADNLLKHVCDAANGVLWVDDCQATATVAIVEYDKAEPRTVVAVSPHRSSMLRDLSKPPSKPTDGLPLWD